MAAAVISIVVIAALAVVAVTAPEFPIAAFAIALSIIPSIARLPLAAFSVGVDARVILDLARLLARLADAVLRIRRALAGILGGVRLPSVALAVVVLVVVAGYDRRFDVADAFPALVAGAWLAGWEDADVGGGGGNAFGGG